MLRICGANLHLVEAVPYKNPKNYVRYSETLSKKIKNSNGVLWANQFDNLSNKSTLSYNRSRNLGSIKWKS